MQSGQPFWHQAALTLAESTEGIHSNRFGMRASQITCCAVLHLLCSSHCTWLCFFWHYWTIQSCSIQHMPCARAN